MTHDTPERLALLAQAQSELEKMHEEIANAADIDSATQSNPVTPAERHAAHRALDMLDMLRDREI
jgi:hypothetical protein